MDRQPISREGYEKLREEIRLLEQVEMPKVLEGIKTARSEGDLSENAEYHGQRETQGMIQAKINQLKARLAVCYIVERTDMPKGVVTFGSVVVLKDLSDGSEEQYELVGPGEEDYAADPMKILTSSPVAQGLIGKKVGDSAEVDTPSGRLRLEITAIHDPE